MRSPQIFLLFLSFLLPPLSPPSQHGQDTSQSKRNPHTDPRPDLAAGKSLFEDHCALCHAVDGSGGRGPNLHRPKLTHASDDQELRTIIEDGISPGMPEGWYLSPEDLVNVAGYVRSLGTIPPEKLPGDPVRGQLVYARKSCAACHILAGEGNGFGPDLTEIGIRRGSAQLREALLHPASALPENFLLIEATTSSGQTIRGIRINEDTFTIQLRDISGHTYSLRKSELKELTKLRDQSPMPSYQSVIPTPELEDLVAYLAAQRGQS